MPPESAAAQNRSLLQHSTKWLSNDVGGLQNSQNDHTLCCNRLWIVSLRSEPEIGLVGHDSSMARHYVFRYGGREAKRKAYESRLMYSIRLCAVRYCIASKYA